MIYLASDKKRHDSHHNKWWRRWQQQWWWWLPEQDKNSTTVVTKFTDSFFFPCTALKTIFFLPCTLDTETILFCLVIHWKLFLLLPCIPLKTNLIISQDEILNNSTIYPNVVTDLNSESYNKQTLRQYFFLTINWHTKSDITILLLVFYFLIYTYILLRFLIEKCRLSGEWNIEKNMLHNNFTFALKYCLLVGNQNLGRELSIVGRDSLISTA